MKFVQWMLVMFLGVTLIAGCGMFRTETAPVSAPPTATYTGDTLQASYSYPFEQTWNATLSALGMLNMPVVRSNKVAGGLITATGTDGTPIGIQLTPQGPGATIVNIKVGSGNEAVSRSINSMIANQLGGRP